MPQAPGRQAELRCLQYLRANPKAQGEWRALALFVLVPLCLGHESLNCQHGQVRLRNFRAIQVCSLSNSSPR